MKIKNEDEILADEYAWFLKIIRTKDMVGVQDDEDLMESKSYLEKKIKEASN